MIRLSDKWLKKLASEPETGMGYQVASVVLTDGRRFDQVVIVEGRITEIRGLTQVPFEESQIADLVVTHEKWDFGADR
jgi:hypothetical protein